MDTIQKLTDLFKQFPGIGPRQAKRFVYFLLTQNPGYTKDLTSLISTLQSQIVSCDMCKRFFPINDSVEKLCPICRDSKRDVTLLMIVCRDVDFENIEKTKSFAGYYFVLGGLIPLLAEHPEERIREKDLRQVLATRIKNGLKEVILALDYNPEGEHTREYVQNILGPLSIQYGFRMSALGRGLSMGSELEYSDPDTIKNALQSRK